MSQTPHPERKTDPAEAADPGATQAVRALIGQTIADRYRVERLIGEGGMGAVYLAEHVMMEKPVALKVLHQEMSQHQEIVARFQREARAAAAISHPNICAATDFGRLEDGAFFLVMEHLDGRTLEAVMRAHGRLGAARVIKIVDQICSVLDVAHDKGIVHRDLKPENVMLVEWDGDDDVVKIMDFGIASMRPSEEDGDDARLTRAGVAYGTPTYMSPEQVSGEPDIDGRADLYTLGAMMYEMLTGRPPFTGNSITRLMSQHLTERPASLREVCPEAKIPAALDDVVLRLLEKEREDRFQSAGELREALEAIDLDAPSPAATSLELIARPLKNASPTLIIDARDRFNELPQHVQLATLAIPILIAMIFVAGVVALTIGGQEPMPDDPAERAVVEAREVSKTLAEERDAFVSDTDGMRPLLELMAAGKHAEALEELTARADELGESPHYHYYLGVAHLAQDDPASAITSHEQAIALDARYARDAAILDAALEAITSKNEDARAVAARLITAHDELRALAAPRLAKLAWEADRRERRRAADFLEEHDLWKDVPAWRRHAADLRQSKGCKPRAEAIAKLAEASDPAALEPLRYFADRPRKGCGFLKQKDCYGCIRDDLKRAIEALEAKFPDANSPAQAEGAPP